MKHINVVMLLVSLLGLASTLEARPRDPARERSRCDAALRLCKNVAGIDYRNCNKAGLRSCSADYQEDVKSCNDDHRSCIDRIR